MTTPNNSSRSSPFRPDCCRHKVLLITGGGSGIGLEIARQLLRAGCHAAILCGRRQTVLETAVDFLRQEITGANVDYQICDVRNYAACEKAVKFVEQMYGRLDILINAAAGNFLAPAAELSAKGFATVMAIDALGTFHMCRAAYPLLKQSKHDPIIINISMTLHYGATWWQAHASAAKSAVDSLTRSLALEWGPDGIRVCGIAPGGIADTPGTAKLAPAGLSRDMLQAKIPLGRLGEAHEIGQAAIYLVTAQYVTGHTLVVDGGEWLADIPLIPKQKVAELSRKVEAKSRQMQFTHSNL